MGSSFHLRGLPVETRIKLAASVLLGVPFTVLLVFAVGEMVGGELSGAQHLVQAAPLLLLLVAAWRYPRMVGLLLLGLGALLFGIWLIFFASEADPHGIEILGWVVSGLLLFIPPLAAGWLLLRVRRG